MIGKNVSLIHALSDSKWCHTFISSWKLTFRMHPFCSWFRVFTEFQKQPLPNFLQLYWKETPAQVFFCKFCEIFKNIFFYRTPRENLHPFNFNKSSSKRECHCGEWNERLSEAIVRRFFEISQNSQESTCARDSFLKAQPCRLKNHW